MMFIVLLPFLLCPIQAQFDSSEKIVLRRIVRNAVSSLELYIQLKDKIIIDNCKANEQYEAAEKLKLTFNETKACLFKKKISGTPREDYLAHIDECNRESVKQSKSCLAESQRYFPDLLLMYYKSIINFRYENYDIINDDCFSKFRNTKVQTNYYQCLKEGVIRIGDSPRIPDTKEVFCQKIVETPSCFMNFIKENCNNTAAVKKVVKDYIAVVKNVCKTNKAVQCGTFKPFLIVTLIYLIKLLF